MLIYSAATCNPKSDNNDSISLVMLGALASAMIEGEDLSCQNETLNWNRRTPASANYCSCFIGHTTASIRVMTASCE